jgi:hypothetical protein
MKMVSTTRSISTPLIIYLVPLWLRSAGESLAPRKRLNIGEEYSPLD